MFLYIKEVDNKKLQDRYGVPPRTLQNWAKEEMQEDSWRGSLYRELKTYALLEEKQLAQLKKLFTQNELKALIACVNGTMYGTEFFLTDYWAMHFADCCIYEPMQVAQFLPEGADMDLFKKSVTEKLSGLDMFGRYVLSRYVFGFWEQKEKDLDAYVSA